MGILDTKACIIITAISSVLFFIIGGVIPVVIDKVLNDKIEENLVLSEDNSKSWAATPGDIGIKLVREMISFQFLNSEDVIFRGKKPEFKETPRYNFIEESQKLDRKYSDDKKVVNYNLYEYYLADTKKGTTGEEEIEVMNLGPLAVWHRAKSSSAPSVALSALSSIFTNLNNNFQNQVLAGAIGVNIFANYNTATIKGILDSIAANKPLVAQQDAISTDPNYGMGNSSGLKLWVDATLGEVINHAPTNVKPPGETFAILQNYFGLTYDQMIAVQAKLFTYLKNANLYTQTIKTAYCDSAALNTFTCNKELFSAAQWTQQIILGTGAGKPALSDLDPTNSASIELSHYYEKVFKNMVDSNPYKVSAEAKFGVTFGIAWALKVMAYKTDGTFTKENNAFLNIGNLNLLFQLGAAFDASKQDYSASEEITKIQAQFEFESKEHTFVFWNYIKYVVAELARKTSIGGTNESVAIGSFASGGVSKSFKGLTDFLLPTFTAAMMEGALKTAKCNDLFKGAGATDALAIAFCDTMFKRNDQPLDSKSIIGLNQICSRENQTLLTSFTQIAQSQVTSDTIRTNLCNEAAAPFGLAYKGVSQKLAVHYQCTQLGAYPKCTNWEFAAKQWAYGTITTNIIAELATVFKAADSISSWFPTIFTKPVEFYAISKKFQSIFKSQTIFSPTPAQLKTILSSGKMFSASLISNVFIWSKKEATVPKIATDLIIDQPDQALTFLRYIVIEVTFGGFTHKLKSGEAFFGYDDQFLKSLSERNPQVGGDPSIRYRLALNSRNTTSIDDKVLWNYSIYTGKGDIKKLKHYETYSEVKDHIATLVNYFDGREVKRTSYNPWEVKQKFIGNDGGQSHPNQKKGDKNTVFVTSVLFPAHLDQVKEQRVHGLDCFRYEPPKNFLHLDNKYNQGYFFEKYDGLLNLTKYAGVPVYSSQPHFYNADPKLEEAVTVYNTDGNIQKSNKWDQTFVISEKWTGTSLSVAQNLQQNYEMAPDLLFPVTDSKFLPIYYIFRAANWTDSQVDDKFGGIKSALTARLAILIIGFTLGGITFIATFVLLFRYKKMVQRKKSIVNGVSDVEYQKGNDKEIDSQNRLQSEVQ